MRIAYFTPLNPLQGGISDHSEDLLPHLAPLADVDVVTSGDYVPSTAAIREAFRIRDYRDYLAAPGAYDAALYQLGNNLRRHAYMVQCLRAAPGIVVLQDYCLQYLALGVTLRRGELGALEEALRPVYGERARRLARRLLFAVEDPSSLTFAHPFLAASRGVVVHSEHALGLVRAEVPGKPAHHVPMGVSMPPPSGGREDLRRRHGYAPDAFVVASVSTRAPRKRLDVTLRALRRVRDRVPRLRLVIVGGGSPGAATHRLIGELGLEDVVEQTGWVDAERYRDLVHLADVAVDVRETTGGETAHSALRCLVAGTPVVVSAAGTFLELPDEPCPKIAPGPGEVEALGECLSSLAGDRDRLRAMSAAALAYARDRLTMQGQARELVAAVQAIASTTAGEGPVALLEPRGSRLARPLLAALYNACRTAQLVRSYGIGDGLRRMRVGLGARLGTARESL